MFIAQSTLEGWVSSGLAEVGDHVVMLWRSGRAYRLDAAVRFVQTLSAPEGVDLVGKVLSERRVRDLGGEVLEESVLFGESAFEIQRGFIGTLMPAPGVSPEVPTGARES